jgi:hypothetical protein
MPRGERESARYAQPCHTTATTVAALRTEHDLDIALVRKVNLTF